jgi:hypothetical protein
MKSVILCTSLFLGLLLTATGCVQRQFYWGSYEDSLFSRQQHAGPEGEAGAATMLISTLNEAESNPNSRVGPGIHADYGYLLLKRGNTDEAIAQFTKEGALFPEAKPLMDTMITRIQERKKKEAEGKPEGKRTQ